MSADPPFSVAVVIPLFNKEGAIARTIGSVLRQSRAPEELIVVDDGSTDMSATIADQVLASARSTTSARVIAQENAGVSAARNRGANESRSRYIAFLDADDEWSPDCLAEFEKLARAFPSATVLSVRLARIDADNRVIPEPSALPKGFFGLVENPTATYRRGTGLMSSSSVAVRRDAWQRSGGFPVGAANGEDIYLWLKLFTSETLAHSAAPLSIWRDEHSGLAARKGIVPYHFSYFLGTSDGKRDIRARDISRFIESNLIVQIGSHRSQGDQVVVAELRRLSRALPLAARVKCGAVSMMPPWALRAAARWRKRSRRRRAARP